MREIYRNKHYQGRNYECTNVVACERLNNEAPKPDPDNWKLDCNYPVDRLTALYVQADIRYFGHL